MKVSERVQCEVFGLASWYCDVLAVVNIEIMVLGDKMPYICVFGNALLCRRWKQQILLKC
jgi:hypothetical protein